MESTDPNEEVPTDRGHAAGARVLGRFRLIRRLGQGGMGEVWLARDERLDCDVALKFLQERFRRDEAALLALRTETRRTRELTHPGIVRIHDLHEGEGHTAIAMEFLPGGSVHMRRCRLDPPVLDPDDILGWLPRLCDALEHAHAAGVVHRDIKPSNLLIEADGAVKIGDFGIAQPLAESALRISQWAPSGTLAYMGPQQHFGDPPAAADDIYALGATLYELLTSKPPFFSGNLAAQIERRAPDRLQERRRQLGLAHLPPLSAGWEEAVAACLEKRAEDRPAGARAVLDCILRRAGGSRRGPGRIRPLRLLASRPVRLGVMAGAVAAILAGSRLVQVEMAPDHPAAAASKPSAAVTEVHPSDATRAWAAWNLDGDGRDASGRGLDLELQSPIPAKDRFGRIDRALMFNGMGYGRHNEALTWDWTAATPFSVSAWISMNSQGRSAMIVGVRSERQDDLFWYLGVSGKRAEFQLGRVQMVPTDAATDPDPLPVGRWVHLAAVSDGQALRLWVDGREVAQAPIVQNREGRISGPAAILLGATTGRDPEMFNGTMDDLRIWRRALKPEEIARLASPEPPPRLVLTRGIYSAESDLSADVVREFGPGAQVADWRDIERWRADDVTQLCDELELSVTGPGPLVQSDGSRRFTGSRHYFIDRFDGRRPAYYMAHAELGGMTLALGSWNGMTTHVLAKLPFTHPRQIELRPSSSGLIEQEIGEGVRRKSVALEWTTEIRPGGSRIEAVVRTRDGRVHVAQCHAGSDGRLALALGSRERPERARQFVATYGPLIFTLVARGGTLSFRAIAAVGSALVFNEELDLPADIRPGDIVSVTLSGVDGALLTLEE